MFKRCCAPRPFLRKGIAIALLAPLAIAALGYVVMALWNGLLPPILGVKTIHFWQAIGLLILSRILFGGFHHRHAPCVPRIRRMPRLARWDQMTPEEREKFRQGLRRCGCKPEKD